MSQITFGLSLIFFVWTHLCNDKYLMLIKGWTADQIFPFCLFVISLPLNNFSSQYGTFNIEHRQLILIHFFFSVNCDNISIKSNEILKLYKDRLKQIYLPRGCMGYTSLTCNLKRLKPCAARALQVTAESNARFGVAF